jgi:hypothetical protein
MDEFRKSYDYFEEQGIGGLLLVLFFLLITAEPLAGIMSIYFGFNSMSSYGFWGMVFQAAAIIYTVLSVLSGIVLKKMFNLAVPMIKVFLVFRMLFLVPYIYVNMSMQITEIPYEKTYVLYQQMHASIVSSFVFSMAYVIVFSALWYIYLLRSRRVKETFPRKAPESSVNAQ